MVPDAVLGVCVLCVLVAVALKELGPTVVYVFSLRTPEIVVWVRTHFWTAIGIVCVQIALVAQVLLVYLHDWISIVVGFFTLLGLSLYLFKKTLDRNWEPSEGKGCLKGKVCIVTGGNSGLGYAVAGYLAQAGVESVIIACKNATAGKSAAQKINLAVGELVCTFLQLDLGSLDSVKSFATAVKERHSRVHILVNNAGILKPRVISRSVDGHEAAFATNFLGHFYLTQLLWHELQPSKKDDERGCVATVTSYAQLYCKESIIEERLEAYSQPVSSKTEKAVNPSRWDSYAESKLFNTYHSFELFRRYRGQGVSFYAVHPGVTDTPIWTKGFVRHPYYMSPPSFFHAMARWTWRTPEQGACSIMSCLVDCFLNQDRHVKDEASTGEQKDSEPVRLGLWLDGTMLPPTAISSNTTLSAKLWDVSTALIARYEAKNS